MNIKKQTVAILGAGITGLVSAYYLSKDYNVLLIEKETSIGGTASSFQYKDFILDYGPHKIYTELPGIREEIEKICPLLKIKKKNSIYLNGYNYEFPLRMGQIATKMPSTAFKAGMEIFTKSFNKLPDDSYENYLVNRFGRTLYNLSFRDYAKKIWRSDPKELDAELAKRRVAISGIFQLIKSVLLKDTKQISAEYFYYPKYGIRELLAKLASKIIENKGKIIVDNEIKEINFKEGKIDYLTFGNHKIKPDYVVSTIPLDSLAKVTRIDNLPLKSVEIKYQDLKVLYFILKKPKALNDCWIFFPEEKWLFQRISEQKAFSEFTSPKDKTALMVETTSEINPEIMNQIVHQLEEIGILKDEEIEEWFFKTIKKAYPIYKKGFSETLYPLIDGLESLDNFYLLGRQGLFNYNNMDQCWDMGMKIAEQISKNKSKSDWQETKKYFDSYRIVD
ncbi:MAG: FAD-dependent oxidoreductase [archaeon]|nr:FAD-dependent oxidoreductase [archaeon]